MSNIDKLLYIDGLGEITQNLNIGGNINLANGALTGVTTISASELDIIDFKYKYSSSKPSNTSTDPPGLHIYNTGASATGGTNYDSQDRPSNGLYFHQTTQASPGWLIHVENAPGGQNTPQTPGYPYLVFKTDNIASGDSRFASSLVQGNLWTRGYVAYWFTETSMNFTGQHRCVPNNIYYYNNINDYIGLIVYATGDYKTHDSQNNILHSNNKAITINDSLPVIELTNKKKDKSVFGIISNKEEEERCFSAGAFCTPVSNQNDDKRLYINSVGEGAIWIVNTNGNLENGDYIQSSNVIGMGEKQDDDLLHNYTVAKITCNCNFDINSTKYNCVSFVDSTSGNTYLKAFVGCTYHCG